MAHIKGMSVILCEKRQISEDPFKRPIYEETEVVVENVIVSPVSSDDLKSTLDLTGKKSVYTLGIPKVDNHEWEDKHVKFFGHTWQTIGFTIEGISENIPMDWDRKIQVELYE